MFVCVFVCAVTAHGFPCVFGDVIVPLGRVEVGCVAHLEERQRVRGLWEAAVRYATIRQQMRTSFDWSTITALGVAATRPSLSSSKLSS